jgi:hypothetical protein
MDEEEKREVPQVETRLIEGKLFTVRDLKESKVKRLGINNVTKGIGKGTAHPRG